MGVRDAARGRYNSFDESRLCCYGCSNSDISSPWPGTPSYENQCLFCIRNPLQHMADEEDQVWHNGSDPISIPMDAYSTIDMNLQVDEWISRAKVEDTEALQRILEAQRKLRRATGEDD